MESFAEIRCRRAGTPFPKKVIREDPAHVAPALIHETSSIIFGSVDASRRFIFSTKVELITVASGAAPKSGNVGGGTGGNGPSTVMKLEAIMFSPFVF